MRWLRLREQRSETVSLRAVIFDLFGTLVDNWPVEKLNRMHARVAEVVGAPGEAFALLWMRSFEARTRGDYPTSEAYLEIACGALGVSPTPDQLAAAARLRLDIARETFTVREDAVETLTALKARGLKLGMISDCAWETPVVWGETALAPLFDEAVFSSVVRMKKPDPRIYLLACERLGVRPEECLYVGDGGSRELSGAAAVGMCPVLIRAPHETTDAVHRVDGEEWEGPRVSALGEVAATVDEWLGGGEEEVVETV